MAQNDLRVQRTTTRCVLRRGWGLCRLVFHVKHSRRMIGPMAIIRHIVMVGRELSDARYRAAAHAQQSRRRWLEPGAVVKSALCSGRKRIVVRGGVLSGRECWAVESVSVKAGLEPAPRSRGQRFTRAHSRASRDVWRRLTDHGWTAPRFFTAHRRLQAHLSQAGHTASGRRHVQQSQPSTGQTWQ